MSHEVAELLERAERILAAPPGRPHIVRPPALGDRLVRCVLPLELCRPLTEEDKRRFMGLEPEEMAQQLYFEAEAARKDAERKKAWEQANPGLEPGMVKF